MKSRRLAILALIALGILAGVRHDPGVLGLAEAQPVVQRGAGVTLPYRSVKEFGAKCDNATDDAAAFISAIASLPSGGGPPGTPAGGTVQVPTGTCLIGSTLSFKNLANIRFVGGSGISRATDDTQTTTLVYTASTGSLITAEGTRGLEIGGINLVYSHASYSGILIDLQQGTGSGNTTWVWIHDGKIGGMSTSSKAATSLINLNLSNDINIERCSLTNAAVGIDGPTASVINANRIGIRNNWFNPTFSTIPIRAAGQAWTIEQNVFEPKSGTIAGAFDTNTPGVRGLYFAANWLGDSQSGTWFQATGGAITGGNIIGNEIQGSGTTNGLDLGSAAGLAIMGNRLEVSGTAITAGAATDVIIGANSFGAVSTRVSGNPGGSSIVDGQLQLGQTGRNFHAFNTSPSDAAAILLGGTFVPNSSSTGVGIRNNVTITGQVSRDEYGLWVSPTINKAGSGTHGFFASQKIDPPTIGGSGATVSSATSLWINGEPSGGSNNYAMFVTSGKVRIDGPLASIPLTFTDAATTPAVSGSNIFKTANSGATTITNFTSGFTGQRIVIIFTDANTTVQNNANIKLAGAVNFVSTADDTLSLVLDGTLWRETGRSVN